MAQSISAPATTTYRGLPRLFEFVNDDGDLPVYNCGQAAVATMLRFLQDATASRASNAQPPAPELPDDLLTWVEKEHPPDNLGGWLGTSRRRVERGLRAFGHRPRAIHGEDNLRRCLEHGLPAIVSFQLVVGRFWKFDIPSGHWVVVFGYDADYVYITNWWEQRITWPDFREGWFGWVPALTNMRGTGLIVPPTRPTSGTTW